VRQFWPSVNEFRSDDLINPDFGLRHSRASRSITNVRSDPIIFHAAAGTPHAGTRMVVTGRTSASLQTNSEIANYETFTSKFTAITNE
jgi:hypothetical protein